MASARTPAKRERVEKKLETFIVKRLSVQKMSWLEDQKKRNIGMFRGFIYKDWMIISEVLPNT
jgi:hypothetical protein